MGIIHNRYKFAWLVLPMLCMAPPAHAQEAALSPLVLNGRYVIAWGAIPLGRIIIEASEDATSYRMGIDTKTKGLAALISRDARIATAHGSKSADGSTYIPAQYMSENQKDEDGDAITLTYDAKGKIATRVRKKEDDPSWRPLVPNESINTAHDPITAAFVMRRMLYAQRNAPAATLSTRTYDGMRLAEMTLEKQANASLEIMGAPMDTIPATIRRQPLLGYTSKELKKHQKGDPMIRLYFSNDAAFLPVHAAADAGMAQLTMTLISKQ
jgi:hypothetical protein